MSTTALHWLTAAELTRTYADLGRLIRPGGVFVNGDHLPWGTQEPRLATLGSRILRIRSTRSEGGRRGDTWRHWWEDVRHVPELRSAFVEHDRRFDRRLELRPPRADLSLDLHARKLRAAGFRTVATIWQDFENRVLFARR